MLSDLRENKLALVYRPRTWLWRRVAHCARKIQIESAEKHRLPIPLQYLTHEQPI